MASRILGFVRDIMIAAFLGSGPIAQAWFVAFSLPNMFRRFFAEGAFNAAFAFANSSRNDISSASLSFFFRFSSAAFRDVSVVALRSSNCISFRTLS